jgi:hypothetical protein
MKAFSLTTFGLSVKIADDFFNGSNRQKNGRIGYARVPIVDQDHDVERDALVGRHTALKKSASASDRAQASTSWSTVG